MRNRKLLYVLIPVIIMLLILIAGVVYLKINSSPEKIFKTAINSVFNAFETSKEQFSTVKGTMNLTASIDSENEQVKSINEMLEGTSINLDMQADTANMIINENLNLIFNNESLLNASILLQDQKGYIYLKDFLDKYLEIPQENMEYSDLTEYYKKIDTLDQNALNEAIKEELIAAISAQKMTQEETTLILDGQETKVTASVLDLKNEEIETFSKGLLTSLKANEKFQTALGTFKYDTINMIDELIKDLDSENNLKNMIAENQLVEVKERDEEIRFLIYTKGLLNEFVGFSVKEINVAYNNTTVLEILKQNRNKYEFTAYTENNNRKNEILKLTVEDKKESKNKGTVTITITVEEEQFIATYKYEKQGKQTSFVVSTEIEGVILSFSGNATEDGKNVKGNFVISVQEETLGKANLNCAYDFTYGVQVQKVNTQNAVLIDELSEEDQTTIMTNLQNSPLYQLIEQSGLFDTTKDYNSDYDEPHLSAFAYTIKYNVPQGFEACEDDSSSYEKYIDDDYNSIYVAMYWESVDSYLNNLDDSYILTSIFYENQKISDTKLYTVNGKEYKYRTLSYDYDGQPHARLYFAYELDEEYCYVVEVETSGEISMDTIKNFLDVTVE